MSNVQPGEGGREDEARAYRHGQVVAYEAILRELAELATRVRGEVARLDLPRRAPRPRVGDER